MITGISGFVFFCPAKLSKKAIFGHPPKKKILTDN